MEKESSLLFPWTWKIKSKVKMLSHSVVSNSLQPHGLQPANLLCPWGFPGKNTGVGSYALLQGIFPSQGLTPGLPPLLSGKNTGVGSHALLQGIFLIQRSNPGLLHYHLSDQGKPIKIKPHKTHTGDEHQTHSLIYMTSPKHRCWK